MSSEVNLFFRLRVHGEVPPSLTPLHMSTATEQTPSEADSLSANQKLFRLLWKWNVHYRVYNSALYMLRNCYSILTPWSRVLLEKLTGAQIVKKFPTFYGNRRFHYPIHKFPPPVPILS
jgi:hypothetical protein